MEKFLFKDLSPKVELLVNFFFHQILIACVDHFSLKSLNDFFKFTEF